MLAQALAERPAELAITEGWFNVFGAGSQAPSAEPRYGSRAHAARDGLRTSEYSVQLGEAMYCAIGEALALLCAMAPEVHLNNMLHFEACRILLLSLRRCL